MLNAVPLLLSVVLAGGVPARTAVIKAPPVVTIRAKDYSFLAPKTVRSGVTTFRLVNDGKELHHLTIIRLDKGKTLADLAAALKNPGPPPAWATDVGGPNAALPGRRVEATLTLDAGQYAMVCVIPSPGSPLPHVMKGMIGAFTVIPARSGGTEPATDATIRMSDYAFTLDKPLTAGHHDLKVTNDAAQPHEVVFVQLPPGKTIGDLGTWVEKGLMQGPPPGRPMGGMTALSKGRSGSFPIDLQPGRYGMICFLPDLKDGKPHFAHGMTKEFTVAAK